jgi:DNA-binding transcriptional MocR family regulator
VAVARRFDLHLVEDDAHGLLQPEAPPPLANSAPERTFYVTSTSKVLAGGLRVAFVAVPASFVERLTFAVAASLWVTPPLTLELAVTWIEDGTADGVVARKRDEAMARQRLAGEILGRQKVRTAEASYFLWLELPASWSAESFAATLRARGVVVAPADAFAVGPPPTSGVRISLSAPPDRELLRRGLTTVTEVLASGAAPAVAMV